MKQYLEQRIAELQDRLKGFSSQHYKIDYAARIDELQNTLKHLEQQEVSSDVEHLFKNYQFPEVQLNPEDNFADVQLFEGFKAGYQAASIQQRDDDMKSLLSFINYGYIAIENSLWIKNNGSMFAEEITPEEIISEWKQSKTQKK